MKKLLFLLIATLLTLSLSAHRSFYKLTAEDIEVHEILMELRADGDIILPEIHVIAYTQQDTTKVKAQSQDQTHKKDGVQKHYRDCDKKCKQAKPKDAKLATPPSENK